MSRNWKLRTGRSSISHNTRVRPPHRLLLILPHPRRRPTTKQVDLRPILVLKPTAGSRRRKTNPCRHVKTHTYIHICYIRSSPHPFPDIRYIPILLLVSTSLFPCCWHLTPGPRVSFPHLLTVTHFSPALPSDATSFSPSGSFLSFVGKNILLMMPVSLTLYALTVTCYKPGKRAID